MFGRHLLRACLIVALGAVAVTVSATAWGQDPATEERLDRLERDLNMLQRQVYGGLAPPQMPGAPPPASGDSNGAAVDVEVRMERLEQQMRDLTGRVEEVGNRVEQLRQRVEQINSDVDMRLGASASAAGSQSAGATPPPAEAPPDRQDLAGLPPGAPPPPGEPPAAPGEPPPADAGPQPIFGTLQPPGTAPPAGLAPPRQQAAVAPPAKPPGPSGSPSAGGGADQQYDYAFSLVKKADYPAAEVALKAFVEHHPNDRLAGSAQYWLGETYYQRGRYLEAASAFAEGYKRYPTAPKAVDDLLKLGMALARANQTQNACLAFGQLQQAFPRAGAAVKERAGAERRRLHC